jgi:hypothetical protein
VTRQAKRLRAEAKADQEVEATMAASTATAKASRKAPACTAEDIVRERDQRGLSWAQVAKNLDLGSPGAARTAYTKLTGRHHSESVMQGHRAPRGSGARLVGRKTIAPQWNDMTDQDEIIERLNGPLVPESGEPGSKGYQPEHWSGSVIVIQRKYGTEEVHVKHVKAFSFGKNGDKPLQVELLDRHTGGTRCFYVADIKEIR